MEGDCENGDNDDQSDHGDGQEEQEIHDEAQSRFMKTGQQNLADWKP